MMKNFISIIIILFNVFIYGQNIPSLPIVLVTPKAVEDVPAITICYEYPNHEAYFPDGTEVFIKKLQNTILLNSVKTENRENIFNAILNFVVERDGSIKDVEAIGLNMNFNTAVEKAVKQIKSKWIPKKHNGNLVRTKIQIPITMNLK